MNVRTDPRLMIPEDVASRIAAFVVPDGVAFMTDIYPFALAAGTDAGEPHIRAATADEVTALLTTGGFSPEKGVDWPGDPAVPTGSPVTWQRRQADEPAEEEGCRLYAGEVVLRSGRGIAGPFFIHEQAARSWALVEALELSELEVHEAQVVPYACVRQLAPALLRLGEAEYRRLCRYWQAPVRPWGTPLPFALPGRPEEGWAGIMATG